MAEYAQHYKEVAPRLRGLRDALDLSEEDLAERTGVSVEEVRRFESGESEIPVGYLVSVAHACGVDMVTLVSGGEPHLHGYSVVEKGKGLSVERRKDYDYRNLGYKFGGRRMEPFLIRVPPKGEDELSFSSHPNHEFMYMLEGRLEVTLGDKKIILEAGDSLYFDSSLTHALRGLDGKEAVFLDVIA